MRKFPLIAAAMLAAVLASPVSAAPVSPAQSIVKSDASQIQEVQIRRGDRRGNNFNRGMKRRDFNRRDRGYNKYRGWKRYGSRPGGWRNRGCVAVGPIWFCP